MKSFLSQICTKVLRSGSHTDIRIICFSLFKKMKRSSSSSHDVIHSITMIHCVVQASALWQQRPISFIWHFIAVRSHQLSAMLKGGHLLIVLWEANKKCRRVGVSNGWGRGIFFWQHTVERKWEGGEGENETTMANPWLGFSLVSLMPSQGFPPNVLPADT